MTEYLVRWEIDIEASNATEAAKKAREIQLDKNSIATVFEVYDKKCRESWFIDVEGE